MGYAIKAEMLPRPEEFVFSVDVISMLMVLKELCEENNQMIKDFLHNQSWFAEDGSVTQVDNNNNIGKNIVQYVTSHRGRNDPK